MNDSCFIILRTVICGALVLVSYFLIALIIQIFSKRRIHFEVALGIVIIAAPLIFIIALFLRCFFK